MKTASLDDLAGAVRDALDQAVVARVTEHVVEQAAAEAALREATAPLCLASHERKVIASLVDGYATLADLNGLTIGAFVCRSRGLAFGLLRARLERGQDTSRDELRELLLAGHRGLVARVDALISEIDQAPVVTGAPLRQLVKELIAADAWNNFTADLRALDRMTKCTAAAFDDRRHSGALDGTTLRRSLRQMAEALTPALRALEEP